MVGLTEATVVQVVVEMVVKLFGEGGFFEILLVKEVEGGGVVVGNGGGDGGEEGGGAGGAWCWKENGEGGLWWPAKSLVVVSLLLELAGNKGNEENEGER